MEEIAYDTKNHYFYTVTMLGYILIIDVVNPAEPKLSDFSLDLTDRPLCVIILALYYREC